MKRYEKTYLIFIGDKKIFADTKEDKDRYIKGLQKWVYSVYKLQVTK